MKEITNIAAFKQSRNKFSGTVGLVATMGALHEGHGSLVKKSIKENDITVVSIFVNPLQFNNSDDYEKYPNTLDTDKKYLKELGVQYLFLPTKEVMYPLEETFQVETDHQYMHTLEGAHRPGHFRGVLTIVLKLLNIVQPDRSYWGEKDFQQYSLIRKMVEDLFLKTEVICCPTVRKESGLPLSSRNLRLNANEKKLANHAASLIHTANHRTLPDIARELTNIGVEVEYLEIINRRVFSAVKVNTIRIIDNFRVEHEHDHIETQ